MRRIIGALAITSFLIGAGCHRGGETGLAHYTLEAGPFAGTINGESAGTFIYKSGDRIYGNMSLGNRSFRFSGFNDPNTMSISPESSNAGFTQIIFQRSGNTWNAVQGGMGSLTQQ